jgi:hypothetical protein
MLFFAVLIPTTILVVIGYFVLFASAKAEGTLKTFGRYLSIWTFALAALLLIGAATAPMFGGRPFGMPGMMRGHAMPGMMQGGGMGERMNRPDRMPMAPPAAPSDTAPSPGDDGGAAKE